jgi:2-polyprenyl-3-methyl-5-hydroxy-6-metoxy-1,4-benzoquinol methylase
MEISMKRQDRSPAERRSSSGAGEEGRRAANKRHLMAGSASAESKHGDDREPWWERYFDDAFVQLYRPFLSAERTWREVGGVLEMLELSPEAHILDAPCGWGRHALELARLGYRVIGLDRSETLLRHAQRLARRAGISALWVRADVREMPYRHSFDAVLCLFSSLGYFLSDVEDVRALHAMAEALNPDGALLLETMHRDLIAREFAERDWWEGERGEHVWVEREFDAQAGVSHETLRWRMPDGTEGEKMHSIRVRVPSEWEQLLRAAGLLPTAWYGGWNLEPFTRESRRLIVVARRAG